MKLEHNMNFENSTCGSRLPTEIYWTWQDGRVFALALAFVGLIGTGLNSLVLIGVGGNAKLGTTVNKLLIWICSMAILESIIGIGVKTLILGKEILMRQRVSYPFSTLRLYGRVGVQKSRFCIITIFFSIFSLLYFLNNLFYIL